MISLKAGEVTGEKIIGQIEKNTSQRNATRKRILEMQMGYINMEISKLRKGLYFPSLIDPSRFHQNIPEKNQS